MRIFLDADVFLYTAGSLHPLKEACSHVLRRVRDGSLAAITSAEVVQEILHVLSRRGDRKGALGLAREICTAFPSLLAITSEDVVTACHLMERYPALSSRDALHAATMLTNGITSIVSVDPDFDLVSEIERIPPDRV